MLSLQLKDGEYLTIGEDIVIQVFTTAGVRVSVQAPKEMAILRGEVLERNGADRPKALKSPDRSQRRRTVRQNKVSPG